MDNTKISDSVLGYRFHVQFHITNHCNLNCKHCYEGGIPRLDQWQIDEFKEAIDKLWGAFAKWGVIGEISLIGGEPTMHPKFYDMVDYLYSRGDVDAISILTNGTRIDNMFIDLVKRNHCYVQISMDGIDAEHHDFIRGAHNFEHVISSLSILREHGISPSVHYVLSKYTTPLNEKFFDFLIEQKIHQISFSRLVPLGNAKVNEMLTKQELKETMSFIDEMKRKYKNNELNVASTRPLWCHFGYSGRCPVGIQTITILENGDIMPCRRLPIVIGNIKKDSFYKVWYTNPVLNDLRNRNKIEACGQCNKLHICGGARCIAYAFYGDYMKKDPQCWI